MTRNVYSKSNLSVKIILPVSIKFRIIRELPVSRNQLNMNVYISIGTNPLNSEPSLYRVVFDGVSVTRADRLQSNLDISNSDISNSANIEASF